MKKIYFMVAALSIMAASCTNDEMDKMVETRSTLEIEKVTNSGIQTRGLFTEASFPVGTEIGVAVTSATGGDYNQINYQNVKFSLESAGSTESWLPERDIVLIGNLANVYGYYPYSSEVTTLTSIPVDANKDIDYMYATPIIQEAYAKNRQVSLVMNHALSAVKVNLSLSGYAGAGSLTNLIVASPSASQTATLDATTGTLSDFSSSNYYFTRSTEATLTAEKQSFDFLVVPNGNEGAVTIKLRLDGNDFTAVSSAVTMQPGTIYTYNIAIDDYNMIITDVSVTPWNSEEAKDLELDADENNDGQQVVDPLG